jgi:hypothetical protein
MIIEQFLENRMRAPDSSCLARMSDIQFKTSGLDPTLTLVITGTYKAQTPFAGTWEATLGGGPDWTLELETDGRVARGTVLGRMLPIYDGSIEGATLSFKLKSPDAARTIIFTGRLQGNELNFARAVKVVTGRNPAGPELFGGPGLRAFTAKRLRWIPLLYFVAQPSRIRPRRLSYAEAIIIGTVDNSILISFGNYKQFGPASSFPGDLRDRSVLTHGGERVLGPA